ncbi:MAG: ATP-dependent DNA helicase RecG [Patiriisocius sp.]|jgi:ATP-dependent DNA helicase RecG
MDSPIEYVKGIGPSRAQILKKELNIQTIGDMLEHFPFRYIDRSKFHAIKDIVSEETYVQLKAKLIDMREVPMGKKTRLEVTVKDSSGRIKLTWFQKIKFVKPNMIVGRDYLIFGKPNMYANRYSLVHPEMQILDPNKNLILGGLQAVYHSGEKLSAVGFSSKGIEKVIKTILSNSSKIIHEYLPEDLINDLGLMGREQAFLQVHQPKDIAGIEKAKFRLKFDEFFLLQLTLLKLKISKAEKNRGMPFNVIGDKFNTFYKNNLPFELTNAQKRVVREIRQDLGYGLQMNRLLQGDVGSGKTIVALLATLIAIDNGYQASFMAPTEILANQHFQGLTELLQGMDVRVELLTGSTSAKARKPLFQDLLEGKIDILIGTHAILEDKVKFKNLGLSVIDEQHRFGVAQRAKMWKKNVIPPHVLVMTATPIPRTLAMTLYGDLDVSIIDELPPGRKDVKTLHRYDGSRLKVFQFIEDEIKKGRQVYLVYPLIEESETLDYKDLMDGFNSIERRFPKPKYQVGILHGRMKPEDKDFEMDRFVKGETQILVSTTVIEVGVNVPNASMMVIESTERFGLSQLHQLRGRVGRGAEQSYCILMSSVKLSANARTRIETMCQTNNGFEIADVDLKLRGPGDIMGTRQSGILDFKIANLATDGRILHLARETAIKILREDPSLSSDLYLPISKAVGRDLNRKNHWSKIS